jgi:hypothetical protein
MIMSKVATGTTTIERTSASFPTAETVGKSGGRLVVIKTLLASRRTGQLNIDKPGLDGNFKSRGSNISRVLKGTKNGEASSTPIVSGGIDPEPVIMLIRDNHHILVQFLSGKDRRSWITERVPGGRLRGKIIHARRNDQCSGTIMITVGPHRKFDIRFHGMVTSVQVTSGVSNSRDIKQRRGPVNVLDGSNGCIQPLESSYNSRTGQ